MHNTLDYFVCRTVGSNFILAVFLWNVRGVYGIVYLRITSLQQLLKFSNLLRITALCALFSKLYVFRQNLNNFNILVWSLYGDVLDDSVVINNKMSKLLTFGCAITFCNYRSLVFLAHLAAAVYIVGFCWIAIESSPEWDLNPRALNYIQTNMYAYTCIFRRNSTQLFFFW